MPEATKTGVTVDFDHHSPTFARNPIGILSKLRDECPVAYTNAHGGYWVVTRYDDVVAVCRDTATYSSEHNFDDEPCRRKGHTIPETPGPLPAMPAEIDPPEYHSYRKVLAPHFSPAAADRRKGMIDAIVHDCIDNVIEAGSADLIVDIAGLSTTRIILDSVGLDVDASIVARAFHEFFFTPPDSPEYREMLDAVRVVQEMIGGAVAERQQRPTDDLITQLLESNFGGREA